MAMFVLTVIFTHPKYYSPQCKPQATNLAQSKYKVLFYQFKLSLLNKWGCTEHSSITA